MQSLSLNKCQFLLNNGQALSSQQISALQMQAQAQAQAQAQVQAQAQAQAQVQAQQAQLAQAQQARALQKSLQVEPPPIKIETSTLPTLSQMSYFQPTCATPNSMINQVQNPTPNQLNQYQHLTNKEILKMERACLICGDRATGLHYGIVSCEGCKGFFKRSICNKRVYKCTRNGQCEMSRKQRNRCQYCRLRKCLQVGMNRKAIREDGMPGGRNKNIGAVALSDDEIDRVLSGKEFEELLAARQQGSAGSAGTAGHASGTAGQIPQNESISPIPPSPQATQAYIEEFSKSLGSSSSSSVGSKVKVEASPIQQQHQANQQFLLQQHQANQLAAFRQLQQQQQVLLQRQQQDAFIQNQAHLSSNLPTLPTLPSVQSLQTTATGQNQKLPQSMTGAEALLNAAEKVSLMEQAKLPKNSSSTSMSVSNSGSNSGSNSNSSNSISPNPVSQKIAEQQNSVELAKSKVLNNLKLLQEERRKVEILREKAAMQQREMQLQHQQGHQQQQQGNDPFQISDQTHPEAAKLTQALINIDSLTELDSLKSLQAGSSNNISKEDLLMLLAKCADEMLVRQTRWIKSLPFYDKLLVKDHITLLSTTWPELNLLAAFTLHKDEMIFGKLGNLNIEYHDSGSEVGNGEEAATAETESFTPDQLETIERLLLLFQRMNSLKIDTKEYVIMKIINFLNQDVKNLENPAIVEEINKTYWYQTQAWIEMRHKIKKSSQMSQMPNSSPTVPPPVTTINDQTPSQRFRELMLCLPEIRLMSSRLQEIPLEKVPLLLKAIIQTIRLTTTNLPSCEVDKQPVMQQQLSGSCKRSEPEISQNVKVQGLFFV